MTSRDEILAQALMTVVEGLISEDREAMYKAKYEIMPKFFESKSMGFSKNKGDNDED